LYFGIRELHPVLVGITGLPFSWGYKYGDLALQVEGISDESKI
jgi:hypothetical protein